RTSIHQPPGDRPQLWKKREEPDASACRLMTRAVFVTHQRGSASLIGAGHYNGGRGNAAPFRMVQNEKARMSLKNSPGEMLSDTVNEKEALELLRSVNFENVENAFERLRGLPQDEAGRTAL